MLKIPGGIKAWEAEARGYEFKAFLRHAGRPCFNNMSIGGWRRMKITSTMALGNI